MDFLGALPIRCETPQFWLLDFLGFPWILSSETRLFKGLHGIFLRKKIFVGPRVSARSDARLPTGREIGRTSRVDPKATDGRIAATGAAAGAMGRGAHRASIHELLIFSNHLPSHPVPFAPRELLSPTGRRKR